MDTIPFSPATLYSDLGPDLSQLDDPFCANEIRHAVMGLANDKSSGPDGVPNEFFKLNWDLLKDDLLAIFDSLFQGQLNLQNANHARIVLIPKEENATCLSAFRPISVISYIPKLISKVLANRVAAFMPQLIPQSQTGFIKGRLIAENFIVARELVTTLSNQSDPAFLLKLDFQKAFDSVAWSFLFKVLDQRGFPPNFISWLRLLFSSSTSSVTVNDYTGPVFPHKRGLRQGDPLSPFLYLLAADVLNKMIQAASLSVPQTICRKLNEPFILLQYADDTLLFSTAKGTAVQVLSRVLDAFSRVSGVQLNLNKCSLVPFNLPAQETASIISVLQVNNTALPLIYLGLPLTLRRPDRLAYQSIIDKLQRKLAGWKSSLLSRAGRVVLASSVLSTVPVFFMSVFKLPGWVIKAIDRIRRNFIWGSSNNDKRAIHLLSWDRVCLPKSFGGFGLLNLNMQNISLLLRWWWRLHTTPDSLWSKIAHCLYSKRDRNVPPIAWNSIGSFFWHDLFSIRSFFQLSTRSIIGSGLNTSFWYSNWGGTCLTLCGYSALPPTRRFISLRHARSLWHELLPSPNTLQQSTLQQIACNLIFTAQPDTLLWNWTTHGYYTASSTYKWLISAGKVRFPLTCFWKLKIPPSIRLFLILLAHGRILTQDQLLKRNIHIVQGCVLCSQPVLETATHLFFNCPFTLQLWQQLGYQNATVLHSSTDSIQAFLLHLFQHTSTRNLVITATTLWTVWLERNNRTFRQQSRTLDAIHNWIICESTIFLKTC
ncbi:hypothetical protein LUZ63_015117 [Rhynchospora breviuscula]|uniref:Reverse transcriptase domain-containing protein n=1 Tax=Rhynchospora breviuscula TaxID=2022672 RepID=A0A9Q0CBQ8_9POAL|nr:hypothetical protein LUZ63_015117 [Rhynchospora breviuscula]